MPVMNSLEIVRAMRADSRWASVPVLVQTSDARLARDKVWSQLHVEKALENPEFRRWLLDSVDSHRSGAPVRATAS